MDAPKQTAPTNEPQRAKTWQAQSRIAGYIKGNVKLEEIVSREKLVRPEHRHNRRALKALIDDDDEPASATFVRSQNRSLISRCPSSSTKTSLSRAGSVAPHQRLTADDLTRTICEKNEHITALRDQLEALRSCARLDALPQSGAEQRSMRAVLERLLECLLDMLLNLRHHDEHDERMAQFVAAVERERENVLRSVDALCQANVRKEEQLRQMSGEQTQMRSQLLQLQQSVVSSDESRACARNTELVERLRTYEHKYQMATEHLRHLSQLAESVRQHVDTERAAFEKRAAEHEKCVEKLRATCCSIGEKKAEIEKRLTRLIQEQMNEIAQLRNEKEESAQIVRRLEDEVQKVMSAEQSLRKENAKLKAQLEEVRQTNKEIRDEVKRLREEKEALETDLMDREPSVTDDTRRGTVENEATTTSFTTQNWQWHELKQCFNKLLQPKDDVR